MPRESIVPAARPPLCVDLDGTLVKTDTLLESLLALVKAYPLQIFLLPIWLLRGRAQLKHEIARRVDLDPAFLPYHQELLAFLRRERAAGRRLVLVTAADRRIASAVAAHLGIFDEVLGSDGSVNLKGARKSAVLKAKYGARGYDYVGNGSADLAVWADANAAVVVNAASRVARRPTCPVEREFATRGGQLGALIREIRLHQWVKNLLVFVPVMTSHEITNPAVVGKAIVAFLSFSACASAVYLLNDLLDLAADRRHPSKRMRPLAAGEMTPAMGMVLVPLCLALSVVLGALLAPVFLLTLAAYVLLTTAYSFVFKHVVLLDVVVLAGLYTIRVIGGFTSTDVPFSPWLLAFAMFFFLSLAFAKRFTELHALRQRAPDALRSRAYHAEDLEQIANLGAASGYISVLVFALYINSDRVAPLYAEPMLLWLICPLLLYWISRVWLIAHRGEMHEDPVLFAIRDRVSYLVGALTAVVLALASWGP